MNQTWRRLSAAQRAGLIVAAVALPCVGGVAALGALTPDDKAPAATQVQQLTDQAATASPTPTATTKAAPVVETRTVTETKAITFKKRTVKDDTMAKGEKERRSKGRDGVRTLTYTVTVVDGRETGRKLVSSEVTRKPVDEVTAIGTYVGPEDEDDGGGDCTPGYDPCVPVASDVDCAGGSGNGPAYVDGPITVTGSDPYDLDRDGDGIACDS